MGLERLRYFGGNVRKEKICVIYEDNPEHFYSQHPAWAFASADQDLWAFSKGNVEELFWTEILPRVKGKKQNHSPDPSQLNRKARERLAEKYIEAESLVSLKITGTYRLYGYLFGNGFNILWFDGSHGDSCTCVCRSHLKHA